MFSYYSDKNVVKYCGLREQFDDFLPVIIWGSTQLKACGNVFNTLLGLSNIICRCNKMWTIPLGCKDDQTSWKEWLFYKQ